MHPAFSVLIFTVTSGFGYGLMITLVIAQMLRGAPISEPSHYLAAFALALGLISFGLVSSTFHLANKRNAWRAFSQFKTSWLSREGVFAIVFYPFALAYIVMLWQSQFETSLAVLVLGVVCVALSFVLTHCTAMIYASLKTIPQWNTHRVPVAFQMFSVYSGVLLYVSVLKLSGEALPAMLCYAAIALALVCAAVKMEYFSFVGQPSRTSINTATSFTEAKVRLFDTGHTAENFVQREFIYEVGPKTKTLARRAVLFLSFVIPILVLLTQSDSSALLVAATLLAYAGFLLERWLFFVDAKHVVRRFYGQD